MRLLPVCTLLLACGAHAKAPLQDWAAELKPASALFAAGDFGGAGRAYTGLAERNPLAQFMLGKFEQEGWGRPRDARAACGWFERAARQHVPAAEHQLAACLAQGIDRPVDPLQARLWYEQAANHGHLISQCSAAEFYIRGRGVARDIAHGLALCAAVAQTKSAPAMLILARYFESDPDVPSNPALARYWYGEAARQGLSEAAYQYGRMLAAGEGGAADLDAGLYWLESAAGAGYAPAYLPTALLYANAPPSKETGVLAPEYLAKTYLWTAAARARSSGAEQSSAAALEALVLGVMPPSWRPKLDQQVAAHLAKYPSP